MAGIDTKKQKDITKFIKQWMFKEFRDEGFFSAKSDYDRAIIKKYEDPYFPPNGDSLGEKITRKFKDLIWRPGPDFIQGMEVFDAEKEQKVNQGRIGDCYLINPISLLAIVQKNMISRLFTIKQFNPFGYYGVWLFIDGKWQYVNVDENFPWWITRKKPYFCDVVGGTQIWAMIIEKAWAKLHGQYSRLWGGDTGQAFRVITGAPTKSYGLKKYRKDPRKKDEVFKQIEYHLAQGHLVSLTTGALDDYGKSIMTQGHSYALLDFRKEDNKYIVRDPRGETNVFGKEVRNDRLGLDYLSYFYSKIYEVEQNMLIQLFHCVIVCLLHPEYVFTQHEVIFDEDQSNTEKLVKLVIDRRTKFTLSFFQPNSRFFKQSQKSKRHKLSKMTFKVLKIDSKDGSITKAKTISQKNGKHQQIDLDLVLNQGTYFIYCLVQWNSETNRKINICSYGPNYVDFQELSSDKKLSQLKEFLDVQRLKREEQKIKKQQQQQLQQQQSTNQETKLIKQKTKIMPQTTKKNDINQKRNSVQVPTTKGQIIQQPNMDLKDEAMSLDNKEISKINTQGSINNIPTGEISSTTEQIQDATTRIDQQKNETKFESHSNQKSEQGQTSIILPQDTISKQDTIKSPIVIGSGLREVQEEDEEEKGGHKSTQEQSYSERLSHLALFGKRGSTKSRTLFIPKRSKEFGRFSSSIVTN